jgi:hypothetical protein
MVHLLTVFALSTFSIVTLADNSPLIQLKDTGVRKTELSGYDFDTDQIFKIGTGPLKNLVIFFAMNPLGGSQNLIPRFVIAKDSKIIDSKELPTVLAGWNIVTVQAVGTATVDDKILRVLAILTLEPASSREADYWDQPFVFEITKEGKIDAKTTLNTMLAKMKPRIKSIKELKSFLRKND